MEWMFFFFLGGGINIWVCNALKTPALCYLDDTLHARDGSLIESILSNTFVRSGVVLLFHHSALVLMMTTKVEGLKNHPILWLHEPSNFFTLVQTWISIYCMCISGC